MDFNRAFIVFDVPESVMVLIMSPVAPGGRRGNTCIAALVVGMCLGHDSTDRAQPSEFSFF